MAQARFVVRCPHCSTELRELARQLEHYRTVAGRLREIVDDANPGPFLGTKKRDRFHSAGCKWLATVPAQSLVRFKTRSEAVEAGRRPCGTCRS